MGFDIGRAVGGVVDAGRKLVNETKDLGSQTVDQGQQIVNQGVDLFEGVSAGVQEHTERKTEDLPYDGHLVYPDGSTQAPGSELQRDPNQPLILHVNGINNDVASQTTALNQIQEQTGAQVIGIHNATEGSLHDIAQAGLDTANKGNNPAVDSMADVIYSELEAGRPVHVMAHSQGALITSRALEQVKQRLMAEGGMTEDQAEAAMNGIQVETFGGAAPSYPDGPQYVHYINDRDAVPVGLGLGPGIPGVGDAGEGAQEHHFWDTESPHAFTTYLEHRVPFDQARQGNFDQPEDSGAGGGGSRGFE